MKIPTNPEDKSRPASEVESTEPAFDPSTPLDDGDPTLAQVAPKQVDAKAGTTLSTTMDETQALSDSKAREASRRSRGVPRIPHFEVVRFLGSGTFGEVWLARDKRTGIQVAIKFFVHGSGGQWGLLQAEVQQLAELHSDPGIVQLIDVEPNAVPPYYVMAFVQNGSLAQRLERGPLPLREALEIFRQIAEALAYVHAKGIRHCDLKPSNILLDVRGRAKIADFGQAHLSSNASPALGTFFYMAPEQADLNEQIADTRWDVYALGAILFAMLTGHPPREDPKLRAEIKGTADLSHRLRRYRDWVEQAPVPREHRRVKGIDRLLVAIIDRCLETDPARRLRDAGAVLEALERRRRTLRQRAMLGFGLIAPVVLMLTMAAFTLSGANRAILASQNEMVEQLARSDSVSARLAALIVEEEIVDRLAMLKARAADPKLAKVVKGGDQKAMRALMAEYGKEAEIAKIKVMRWTITNSVGTTQANYPWEPLVCNQNWSWRDWFNGQGDQHDGKDQRFPAIAQPHISQPFVGKTKERKKGVVLSAPVFDPTSSSSSEPAILGVLALTIELEKVENWLKSVRLNNGFAVLFDSRYHGLLHNRQDRITPRPDENPPVWPCRIYRIVIEDQESGHTVSYRDPVDHKVYLAGYASMPRIGWGVIVQHDRERVLDQIASVTFRLMRISRVAFIAAGLLISALWGWQFWTLRHVQRMADA
ncbi:serine/threonine protein kinase [Singulisphaera acidiphila]|uniref:Serine/threonine protein kinase n=1 Tax=Singulisphaera acidiphila (strain ATCC BAA-1392 / DSM 18658 / VKM B-2454 / MOB10) TaxID=886293 RepID=L0DII7_SINAD|nr:serine/threonine protein kinase [Singulisphaera acidiphila]AGA29072.1 serine/threonine protein kinase [Singulisphaera acidiphila DSM 18658]